MKWGQGIVIAIAFSGLSLSSAQAQNEFEFPGSSFPSPTQSYPSRNPTIPPSTIPSLIPLPANTVPQQVYRVEVMGYNDPFLLSQVQSLVPDAFMREGDGTIQVGSFRDRINAQQQADSLARQGIQASIVTANVSVYPGNTGLSTGVLPNRNPKVLPSSLNGMEGDRNGRFLVVIPVSDANRLDAMTQEALALGLQPDVIQQRSQPLGLHLAIGPFASRSTAEAWNTRLRSQGMDARLHFR
ncbi:MAG: SPOR domain-containing protein [Jaaginema sp. PMC 1079.18]|nr:SPOR domain-containing protein [Jaaginema sp. PMC 1080.18]MEC4850748.1 SPOR domain-containing protein [Jaaginema sp. PMC 1079.18]